MEETDHHHHHGASLVPNTSQEPAEEAIRNEQIQQDNHPFSYSYRLNISNYMPPCEIRDDVWSCVVVLISFWFFASMTLILGFYGSLDLELHPNCSRLITTNSLFVQSIQVEELDEPKHWPMLYGFYEPPSLDVQLTWTETHNAIIPIDFHKEWAYFLNEGSKVDIFYTVKSPSSSPLSLVIAQGKDGLFEWIEKPSYPNSTMSWNIIFGSGKIEQEIPESSDYYIAVGNMNSQDVEVELRFAIQAFIYNTSRAYYTCSLSHRECDLKLFLLGQGAAVLTSPASLEGALWHVKVSYAPRWIAYCVGSGVMTILILFTLRFCNMFQADSSGSEGAPLLSPKDDDDVSTWGSSYDSISHDDQDLDEYLIMKGKPLADPQNLNALCVICFDAPRECFFLPCGHCAACFTCGSRIAEEAATCPICRRGIKKVRKIITV